MTGSASLTLADLPPDGAQWCEVEVFCASLDGYADGAGSIDDLMEIARQVEANPSGASVEDLCATAFIRWRAARWNEENDADAVRLAINELRMRLVHNGARDGTRTRTADKAGKF